MKPFRTHAMTFSVAWYRPQSPFPLLWVMACSHFPLWVRIILPMAHWQVSQRHPSFPSSASCSAIRPRQSTLRGSQAPFSSASLSLASFVPSASHGIAGGISFILAVAFLVLLLGGVLEALFGLMKLGTFIKFAPQPVMAGFQNAAAALLFLVQLGNVCGFDHTIPFTQVQHHLAEIKPLSLIIAAATFATMWKSRSLLPKIPPIIAAIAVGWILYFLCNFVGLGAYLGPLITSVSRPTMGVTALEYFEGVVRGGDFTRICADDRRRRGGTGHHRFN